MAGENSRLEDFTEHLQEFLSRNGEAYKGRNSELPKMSIVMPSFNQAAFIERAIVSVINQQYSNAELIIIDGGSTDGTIDILKRYGNAISYWVSESDRGQSHALNKGFAKATGDIYGWLNADDVYLPGAFHSASKVLLARSNACVTFGDWLTIDSMDRVTAYEYAFDFSVKHMMYEGFHVNSQAMFWRRELHTMTGGIDETLHRVMDYDLIVRMGIVGGDGVFVRVAEPWGCFRRHDGQKTQGFDEAVRREHMHVAAKIGVCKSPRQRQALRYLYRLRRLWWYFKRGGVRYVFGKMRHAAVVQR